jgi:hypothetical protein
MFIPFQNIEYAANLHRKFCTCGYEKNWNRMSKILPFVLIKLSPI